MDVITEPFEDHRSDLDLADQCVAAPTQQPTNTTGLVAVVNDQQPVERIAEETPSALRDSHCLDLVRGQSVLPHESRTEILGLGCIGILTPPLSEPFVALRSVVSAVLAVPAAHTRPAFPALPTPLGEGFSELVRLADSADHSPSIALLHGTAFGLDQPCHADVLIELANEVTP